MWAVWKDPFEMNPIRNASLQELILSNMNPFQYEEFK